MVSAWDRTGERTVGVITKCDIAQDVCQECDDLLPEYSARLIIE